MCIAGIDVPATCSRQELTCARSSVAEFKTAPARSVLTRFAACTQSQLAARSCAMGHEGVTMGHEGVAMGHEGSSVVCHALS